MGLVEIELVGRKCTYKVIDIPDRESSLPEPKKVFEVGQGDTRGSSGVDQDNSLIFQG
jgi:hypothetical protein